MIFQRIFRKHWLVGSEGGRRITCKHTASAWDEHSSCDLSVFSHLGILDYIPSNDLAFRCHPKMFHKHAHLILSSIHLMKCIHMVLHLCNKFSTFVTRSLWIVCPKVTFNCHRIEDFGANVTCDISILMHRPLVIVKATRITELNSTLNAQDWSFWFVLFLFFWSKRLGSLTDVLA